MLEKRDSIPMQNTHDLLVGTLSIGIPSLISFLIYEKRGQFGKILD